MGQVFSAITLALSGAGLVASYGICTVIYRLFLSPLAHIPGPKLAALSSWYECYYDVFQQAQYVFKIAELHKKYGPVVRITPGEVSIADPDFVDTIYAPGPGHKRDKDITKVKALGINTSIGGAVQHDLHKGRRAALNPFFSQQSIARLAPKLGEKVDQLEAYFSKAVESVEVINLSDLYFAFASDIVNQYAFGHNRNLLASRESAHVARENVSAVLRSVKFNLQFPWVRNVIQSLPRSISSRFTPPGIRDMIGFRKKIRKEVDDILNHKTDRQQLGDNKDGPPSIFIALRDSPDLPPSEKSAQRLEDEGTLLVMAGTESTAKALTWAHYHLLASPKIMAKLRGELAANLAAATVSDLGRLPYLSGIIEETHRLSFGLTGRNARVCPDKPVVYVDAHSDKTYTFRPGTSLSTSTLLVHANERLFPDPWTFDPERWLGQAGTELRRYNLAFSRGPRTCIGKPLANAELAVAIAAMARWNMTLYETTADDATFLHDYHVATPKLDSKGVRVTVKGKAI